MAEQVAPTKSNLFKTKKSLKVSKEGYTLLDKKRNVLIHELMGIIGKAKKIQQEYFTAFEEAYKSLTTASINFGTEKLNEITLACEENLNLKILKKSVMGISIPSIENIPEDIKPKLSIVETNPALDAAAKKFKRALALSLKMAEIETTVIRLAQDIKKTQKRANALDYIMIPRYEEIVKFIISSLEEKEREEFFKVKKVKQNKK